MKSKGIILAVVFMVCCLIDPGISYARRRRRAGRADKNKHSIMTRQEIKQEKRFEKKIKEKKKIKKANKKLNWWEHLADTDGDGIVDKKERAAWIKLAKKRIDLNGDGKISRKERRLCWRHARSRVNTKREKMFDTNGNGWLEAGEVRSMLKASYMTIKKKESVKVGSAVERNYDINDDGMLNKHEAKYIFSDIQSKKSRRK